ncbi:unnamed protein product [Anisakis simplex]|uniref:TLDc domain-containing protein n=1 Tax=Anisakis simplex TaxID=6269 RepID=A0A0M3KAW9_ANISI|nr:unnamed protein product [Anisakis simplex]
MFRFAAGGVYGWTGYGFFDFNDHIFLLKAPKRIIVSYCDGAPLNTSSLNAEQFSPKKKRLECGDESAAHVNVASEQTQESIDIGDDDDELIKTWSNVT